MIQDWLDQRFPASEVIVNDSGFAVDDGDERIVVRNMATAKEAFEALRNEAVMAPYRNADVRTYGKALARVPGWRSLGKVRRFGQSQAVWFCRGEDGPRWVEAPPQEDDDLANLLA